MARETNLEPRIGAEHQSRHPDLAVAELAARQHAVVARRQLLQLGLGRRAIGCRLERGRLHPIHRGVYSIVKRRLLRREGFWMGAVLACGPGAALSHRAAAAALAIRRGGPSRIEVTAPRQLAQRPGLRTYERRLPRDEITLVDGIRTTTAARTLLDLATVLSPHDLERALEQAEALRLADVVPLSALMERYRGRRGTATLRAILADGAVAERVTRSELEERFLAFVAARGLPRPELNVPLRLGDDEWVEVDFLWRERRVVVELDGFAHHRTRAAFRRDRRRDRRVRLARFEPVRVTWWDLQREPDQLAADLRALLALTTARRATP